MTTCVILYVVIFFFGALGVKVCPMGKLVHDVYFPIKKLNISSFNSSFVETFIFVLLPQNFITVFSINHDVEM